MPAYNCEQFVSLAVESILCGEYPRVEILVIDDASTDGTANVLSGLATRHRQVKVLQNARKKGPSGARNTGLEAATGEYIAFLDADDLWYPEHLKVGVAFLNAHVDIWMVLFNFDVVDLDTGQADRDWFSGKKFTRVIDSTVLDEEFRLVTCDPFVALVRESFLHLQAMILRREALGTVRFNEDVSHAEDRDFGIRILRRHERRLAFSSRRTGVYHRHMQSLTSRSLSNSRQILMDEIVLYQDYWEDEFKTEKETCVLKEALASAYRELASLNRWLGRYRESLSSLLAAFRYGIQRSLVIECAKLGYCAARTWVSERTK